MPAKEQKWLVRNRYFLNRWAITFRYPSVRKASTVLEKLPLTVSDELLEALSNYKSSCFLIGLEPTSRVQKVVLEGCDTLLLPITVTQCAQTLTVGKKENKMVMQNAVLSNTDIPQALCRKINFTHNTYIHRMG